MTQRKGGLEIQIREKKLAVTSEAACCEGTIFQRMSPALRKKPNEQEQVLGEGVCVDGGMRVVVAQKTSEIIKYFEMNEKNHA